MDPIQEIRKEIERLEKKREKAWLCGSLAKIAQIDGQIDGAKKRLQFIADNEKTTLHELIKGADESIVDEFETNSALMVALVDILVFVVTDINAMINDINPDAKLATTNIIEGIKKLSEKFINITDYNSNAATRDNYYKLSDTLLPVLKKKVQEHLAWTKTEKVNYARE